MKILGIDPGTTRIGYGLIKSSGGDFRSVRHGILEITPGGSVPKLLELGKRFEALLKKLKPEAVAIEKLYFSNNQKTAIAVAEARGVLRFITGRLGLPLLEYGPQEVKLALTNNGRADKTAVKMMVCRTLNLKDIKGPDDVADALAIAITGAAHARMRLLTQKKLWL